ncbi:MAG: amino acid permease [Myxococcota bacterium]
MTGARRFGAATAALTVAASMVGTGVFTTSGFLVADLGSPAAVLLLWGLGGLVGLCGALCYAELGAMIPENGGEYTLIGRVWHPLPGFVAAVVSVVVGFGAPIAGAGIAFGKYTLAAWPALPVDERVLAVGLILGCTAVHAARVHLGAALLNAVTLVQMTAVALVAAAGLWLGSPAHLAAGPPVLQVLPTPAFAVGLVYVGYAYAGWNAASYVAGELRDPHRTLPVGLLVGTLGVTALYVALTAGILMAAPAEALAGKVEVAHVAAVAVLGARAGQALSAVVAFGLVGSVMALLLTGSRVAEAVGRDYLALRWLAHRPAGGGPGVALAVLTAVAAGIGALAAFDWLLEWVGFVLSATATLAVLGVPYARWRWPERARPFRVPALPLVLVVFVAPTVWSMVHTVLDRPEAGLAGLATVAVAGLPWLFVHRAADGGPATP